MAKKHTGLLLLGAAAIGAAAGAYFYLKKTDPDRFDEDDFDFDDFDDSDDLDESENEKQNTRNYVPLNPETMPADSTPAKDDESEETIEAADEENAEKNTAAEIKDTVTETIEEFFDEDEDGEIKELENDED